MGGPFASVLLRGLTSAHTWECRGYRVWGTQHEALCRERRGRGSAEGKALCREREGVPRLLFSSGPQARTESYEWMSDIIYRQRHNIVLDCS